MGGSTIHSFFKMPFRPMLPDDPDLSLAGGRIYELLKYNKKQRQLLREVEFDYYRRNIDGTGRYD